MLQCWNKDTKNTKFPFAGWSAQSCDKLFLLIFLLVTAGQICAVITSPLDLAADETHYWEWSRRLDWSYYSKGPLVAWVIAIFSRLPIDQVYGIKAGALFFSALTSLLFYHFARMIVAPGLALLAWLTLRSMPVVSTLGLFMTTDPLVAFFWLLALYAATMAMKNDQSRWWLLFSCAAGMGFWGKYTIAVLPPAMLLLLLLTPERRRQIYSPVFLLSGLLFLLFLAPILIWNAQHDWVNFQHNAGHVVRSDGFAFKPQYLLELLGGQLGLAGPVIFIAILLSIYHGLRIWWRERDVTLGVLLAAILPLFTICILVSLTRRVYVNWPMPVLLASALLFAVMVERGFLCLPDFRRFFLWWLSPGLLITFVAFLLYAGVTAGLPGKILPTKKLVGWKELGRDIGRHVEAQRDVTGREPFILSTNYGVASSIAFYSGGREVLCANVDGRRMNQYDIWGGWDKHTGDDAIVVLENEAGFEMLQEHFQSLTPLTPSEREIIYSGHLYRHYNYYLGKGFDGRPAKLPM